MVRAYAADMSAGNWQLTGESIKFAAGGALLDGQHRLRAVIESGATVYMFVTRGLQIEAQDVMDTNVKRGAQDMLAMYGHANASLAASAAKWVIFYEEDRLYTDRATRNVSHSDVLAFTADNDAYAEAVAFASGIRKHIDLQPSILAAAVYITHGVDAESSLEFFARLADGIGLPAGSPILALRSRLRDIKAKRTRIEPEASVRDDPVVERLAGRSRSGEHPGLQGTVRDPLPQGQVSGMTPLIDWDADDFGGHVHEFEHRLLASLRARGGPVSEISHTLAATLHRPVEGQRALAASAGRRHVGTWSSGTYDRPHDPLAVHARVSLRRPGARAVEWTFAREPCSRTTLLDPGLRTGNGERRRDR